MSAFEQFGFVRNPHHGPKIASGGVRASYTAVSKYDPDEPRDWHGRWATQGGGSERSPQTSLGDDVDRPSPNDTRYRPSLDDGVYRPGSRNDARLIPAQGFGGNGPPPDPVEEPAPEPEPGSINVPLASTDYYVVNGVRLKWTQYPVMRDGRRWPIVDRDFVRGELEPAKGPKPEIAIWVPVDPRDPMLVGRTSRLEYEDPPVPGYRRVILHGAPQRTYSRAQETNHSYDSIDEALLMARTGKFSDLYFNTSFSVATGRIIQSKIRPDVFGVLRPDAEDDYIYHPFEIWSGGQTREARQGQMPTFPRLKPVEGRDVSKRRPLRLSPYYREVRLPRFQNPALLRSLRQRVRRCARAIQARQRSGTAVPPIRRPCSQRARN